MGGIEWPSLRPWMLAVALGVVLLVDRLIALWSPSTLGLGLLDESGHIATGTVVLAALPRRPFAWLVAFWLGAVAIDLDHVPLVLGSDAISAGTGRPYSHSLLTLVVAALVAVCAPRARPALLAFGAGVLTHFSRDLATGGGVALLWPLSAHRVVVPYAVYVAALALLAVWAWRKGPRWQPGASMRTNGQPGPRP